MFVCANCLWCKKVFNCRVADRKRGLGSYQRADDLADPASTLDVRFGSSVADDA